MFRALLFGAAGLSTWNQLPDWGQYTITGIAALFLLNLVFRILKPTISVGKKIIETSWKIGRWTIGKLRNEERIEALKETAKEYYDRYSKAAEERNNHLEKLNKAKDELYKINQEVAGITNGQNTLERIKSMKHEMGTLKYVEGINKQQKTALIEIRETLGCKENEHTVNAIKNLVANNQRLTEEIGKLEKQWIIAKRKRKLKKKQFLK